MFLSCVLLLSFDLTDLFDHQNNTVNVNATADSNTTEPIRVEITPDSETTDTEASPESVAEDHFAKEQVTSTPSAEETADAAAAAAENEPVKVEAEKEAPEDEL